MTPEQLLKEHTLSFVNTLNDNWEYMGYSAQRLKNGPWVNHDINKWRYKKNYSVISNTEKIYDEWILTQ